MEGVVQTGNEMSWEFWKIKGACDTKKQGMEVQGRRGAGAETHEFKDGEGGRDEGYWELQRVGE